MRKNIFRCIVLGISGFFCLHVPCFAQETYYFTKGLLAHVGTRYSREALYTDPLAWQLYSHTLKKPVAESLFGMNAKGEKIVWQPLEADSQHRFRIKRQDREQGYAAGGSYLYLAYVSDRKRTALLNVSGDAGFFFNGSPHAGDVYDYGWLYIPVTLKKGLNELYVRPSRQLEVSLQFPDKPVQLNTQDPTAPVIEAGAAGNDSLKAAVVLINSSAEDLHNYRIKAVLEGKETVSEIPVVPAMSSRKIPFLFNAANLPGKGRFNCSLTLLHKGKTIDEKELPVEAVAAGEQYSVTFISDLDGSLQYYAVTPQSETKALAGNRGKENTARGTVSEDPPPGTMHEEGNTPARYIPQKEETACGRPALFLSVHGAGVEAIGQARAYRSKDWGTLVAATNRRPMGFDWEDWGRLDALEVLALAKERFKPDPQHIYLTGHSMGGHGTWYLGAAYPGKWAAIGACSGYPNLKDYAGSHGGGMGEQANSPIEKILNRASNQSNVIRLATNYKALGVYILHGDSDQVVPVKYARQMRELLGGFQPDMSYYEYPGGAHWFGNQSVDWKPLFDYFKWHRRKPDSLVNHIDFITACPGISASCYWAVVQQQIHSLDYSRIQLIRDTSLPTIAGTTENIRVLGLSLAGFRANEKLKIVLDGLAPVEYTTKGRDDSLFLLRGSGAWTVTARPGSDQKGPQRSGLFKEAFNHRMVFVYGTTGSPEENAWSRDKARYDAESWYYRGNGAVDIIPDKEYSLSAYAGRSVILFGNAGTNAAWKLLLEDCPIQIERGKIRMGSQVWEGDSLGVYLIWPLRNSLECSVAVIGGSGLKGMEAANANQYFVSTSGYPDYMLFGLDMLQTGSSGIKAAGYFSNDWKLENNSF